MEMKRGDVSKVFSIVVDVGWDFETLVFIIIIYKIGKT